MGAKTEALATQIEGKAEEAIATIQKLGDADWKKVTAAEKWTVGVTAHHLASAFEPTKETFQKLGLEPAFFISSATNGTSLDRRASCAVSPTKSPGAALSATFRPR